MEANNVYILSETHCQLPLPTPHTLILIMNLTQFGMRETSQITFENSRGPTEESSEHSTVERLFGTNLVFVVELGSAADSHSHSFICQRRNGRRFLKKSEDTKEKRRQRTRKGRVGSGSRVSRFYERTTEQVSGVWLGSQNGRI